MEHIEYWRKTNNTTVQRRIVALKNAVLASPYKGIGKPEPLKHELTGKWSRRIDRENRFVYSIEGDTLHVLSLKGHYL